MTTIKQQPMCGRRWMAAILILAALLCGATMMPARASDVYVFLKNGHVGYLDNQSDGLADSWKTFPNGQSFGASFGGHFREGLGSSTDQWTQLVVENNAARNITRDRNVVFLAASFQYRASRDRFMEDGRPWKDVNKYRGRLLHHEAKFGYPWDENVYLMSILTEVTDTLFVGEDGRNHAHDGYVVIEEFDRVRNPLSIEVSLEKPIELEVDSVNGGYRYSNNKNAIRVVYRNAAPYPIRVEVAPPCIDYAFPARRVMWPNMPYPMEDQYQAIDFNGVTCSEYDPEHYRFNYPSGDAEYEHSVFDMLTVTDYLYRDPDTGDHDIVTRGAVLNIPPNGSAYVTWPMNTYQVDMGLPKPTNLGTSFQVMAPAVLQTTLESSETFELRSQYFQLEGTGKQFAFFGAYPVVLPVVPPSLGEAGEGRTLYASLLNADKLGSLTLCRMGRDGSPVAGDAALSIPVKDAQGRYPIDLTDALNALSSGSPENFAGKYRLTFQEMIGTTLGTSYSFDFELEHNVEAIDPDAFATRLVVVQDPQSKQLSMTTYEPARLNKDHILMTITGTMTKEDTGNENIVRYNIGTQSLINGLLKFIRTDGGTNHAATITWNTGDGTIRLATEADDRIGLNAYDTRIVSAPIAVSLDGAERYTASYAKAGEASGKKIILTGGKMNATVDLAGITIQDPGKDIYLYCDAFALSGRGEVGEFLMGASKDYLSGTVEVHESVFGENGYLGARGHMDGHVGVEDPFGIIGLGGAEGSIDFDVLPNSLDRHFRVDGAFDILGAVTVNGTLGFAPIDPYYHRSPNGVLPADIWSINDLNFTYDGTIGVCDLTLGGGFTDLMKADLPEYSFLYNPSPVEAKVTFGLADPTTMDLFGLKGTGVLGGNRIGIVDGSVSVFGTEALHDLTATISFGATEYQGFALPWFRTTSSGRMDFYNVIHGQASLNLGVDLARSRHGLAHARQMVENVSRGYFSGIGDYLYDITDLEYMGKVSLTIPNGVPFAGKEIAGARVDGNKEYVRGIAEVHWDIGPWDVDAYAWVQFKFSPPGISGGVGSGYLKSALAGVPAGMPLYGYEYTLPASSAGLRSAKAGEQRAVTFTSNIIPVQKRRQNVFLRAFGDGYASSVTEPLATGANLVIVQARAKNAFTSLWITTPQGARTSYTSGTLDWKSVKDETGDVLYYETSVAFEKDASQTGYSDLQGDWTIEASMGDEIEAQLYVMIPAETVSNIALSGGNLTFDTGNLDASGNYRLSFALVSDTVDRSHSYPLDTLTFAGNAAPSSIALPDFSGETFKTLNGDYFVQIKLEKYRGEVQFEAGGEVFDSYEPTETAFSAAAIVHHTNVHDPGAVAHVTTEAQGGAILKLAWEHAGDADLDGFHITAVNTNPDSRGETVCFTAPADAREWLVRGGKSIRQSGDTMLVALEVDRYYRYTVHAFHQIDSATYIYGAGGTPDRDYSIIPAYFPLIDASTIRLAKEAGDTVCVFPADRPANTPAALAGLFLSARSADRLLFSASGKSEASQELRMDFRRSKDGKTFVPAASFAGTNGGDGASCFAIPMNVFPEDTVYRIQARIYDPARAGDLIKLDTTIYEFQVEIDNTPPILMLTRIERDTLSTATDRRLLSGTTEAGARLYFQGEDITPALTGKGFSVAVSPDMLALNFKAIDRAGNVAVAYTTINADFFTGDDDTKAVKLLTPYGKNEFRTEADGRLTLPVKTARIDQNDVLHDVTAANADRIDYRVMNGADLAGVTKKADASGEVAVNGTGDFLLMTTYRDFLGDAVLFRILPYEATVINTHSSLTNPDELLFRFDEPADPNGEDFQLRSATLKAAANTPYKQLQYSCDQTTWTAVPTAAVTWFPSDSATIDLAAIPVCTAGGITFFRLYVSDGPDRGASSVTGILLGELPDSEPLTVTATFTGEGFEPFTQTVFYRSQLDRPADSLTVRAGYEIDGWYRTASFAGEPWNFDTDSITADVTLYGKWVASSAIDAVVADDAAVRIYPNPVKDRILLTGNRPLGVVELFNLAGESVYRADFGKWTKAVITVSHLPVGNYLIRTGGETIKLVISE